eukprot:CAMPEP_0177630474 /NCGR_PEP_ID=MMETSP0447-20121125/1229_1 /TAXON_ID=0 /ORGANISM="Stygamoeba regulata, Strain BSH-02190019" /LENGTH=583 /DNA_ID=CAMNT_0019131881 /DNA_START=114 /DNA_END=1865 /DNA_ORIENTATION=+
MPRGSGKRSLSKQEFDLLASIHRFFMRERKSGQRLGVDNVCHRLEDATGMSRSLILRCCRNPSLFPEADEPERRRRSARYAPQGKILLHEAVLSMRASGQTPSLRTLHLHLQRACGDVEGATFPGSLTTLYRSLKRLGYALRRKSGAGKGAGRMKMAEAPLGMRMDGEDALLESGEREPVGGAPKPAEVSRVVPDMGNTIPDPNWQGVRAYPGESLRECPHAQRQRRSYMCSLHKSRSAGRPVFYCGAWEVGLHMQPQHRYWYPAACHRSLVWGVGSPPSGWLASSVQLPTKEKTLDTSGTATTTTATATATATSASTSTGLGGKLPPTAVPPQPPQPQPILDGSAPPEAPSLHTPAPLHPASSPSGDLSAPVPKLSPCVLFMGHTAQAQTFIDWFSEVVVPALPANAVVVVDPSSLPAMSGAMPTPPATFTKEDYALWFASRGVARVGRAAVADMELPALRAAYCRFHRSPAAVLTQLLSAGNKGLLLLQLPRHHPELNPLTGLWSLVEGRVACRNPATLAELESAVLAEASDLTDVEWSGSDLKVREWEGRWYEADEQAVVSDSEDDDNDDSDNMEEEEGW